MEHIELLAIHDHKTNGMAICLKPKNPSIITTSLVHDIRNLQNKVAEQYYMKPWDGIYYLLWYLHAGNIPWRGFDFNYIYNSLCSHHDQQLEYYIEDIFELLFINYIGLGLPLINCSIVHRKLSGISQDFFYLNRINFLSRCHGLSCDYYNHLPINKIDFISGIKKSSFPSKIYSRNNYYLFDSIDLNSMKKIIGSYRYVPIHQQQQNEIKRIFNKKKQETLEFIYQIASEKIDVIKRLALIQSQTPQ